MAPAFTRLNEAAAAALTKFNEWAESPAGQEALEKLGDAAVGLVESITEKDFEGWVTKATEAVESLTGALDWISQNGETITSILLGMGAAWAGLTVTKEVLTFAHLLSNINWDKIGKSGGGAGAVNAAETAVTSMPTPKDALRNGARAVGSAALHAAQKAEALALAEMAVESAVNMYKEATEQGTVLGIGPGNTDSEGNWQLGPSGIYINNEAIENAKAKLSGLWNDFVENFDLAKSEAADAGKVIYDSITEAVKAGQDAAEFTKQQYGSELLGQFYTARVGELGYTGTGGPAEQAELQSLYEDLSSVLEQLKEEMTEGGEEAMKNLTDAIDQNAQQAVDAAGDMAEETQDATEQGLSDMETLGYNAAIGLANGINMGAVEAIGAANDLAMKVQQSIQGALDIHSPSRVMMQLGEYVSQGFAEGIERNISAVQRAMDFVADATGGGVEPAPAPARSRAYGAQGGPRRVVIQIDKRQLAEVLVDDMDTELAAKVRPRR